MQSENRLFDEFAKLTSGATSMFLGAKNEFETLLRAQFEKFLSTMNLVTREEFEVVEAMAKKAREEQIILEERLQNLEKTLLKK